MTDPIYTTVAFVSGGSFAVSNAAGDAFAGEFVPGLRVWADCQADGIRLGTVMAASHDAGAGHTLVTLGIDAGAVLTPNLVSVLHGNDIPESLCSHAAQHAIGGRDPLSSASTTLSGLVRLASVAETQAGVNTDKAVTPAGLATAGKGLISASTTIYVATTGSDTTGTGLVGAPFASIAKALSSIAGKLITSGVTVTIQVADGTYTISSPITIDHPDADKIQILGNTSAETTVAIASIDTTAKTFVMVGNYLSNSDSTKNIVIGDIIGLTGSSTSGLNGAYLVSGVSYDGTNTIITCSAETIASATVGGGSVVIKPCNRCKISCNSGITFIMLNSYVKFLAVTGFRVDSAGGSARAIWGVRGAAATIGPKTIVKSFQYGSYADLGGNFFMNGVIFKNCTTAFSSYQAQSVMLSCVLDNCATGYSIVRCSGGAAVGSMGIRGVTSPYVPSIGTISADGSFISSV